MSTTSVSRIFPEDPFERFLQATDVGKMYDVIPASYFHWKGWIDRVLGLLLLIPGLPIIGLLMLLVKATSRGPGLYTQVRVGKNGREFRMYKIRTMRVDAESRTGPVWTQKRDPRVTHLGRILRKLHLDEFPQLLNVVRGQMSLVGPRPERPEFVSVLAKSLPRYLDRLSVLPGITGLAQINLPPDTDLESVRRKLALDLEYIGQARVSLDLRMLACTLVRVVGIPGELAMRLFALRRNVHADIAPSDGATTAPPTPLAISTEETLVEYAIKDTVVEVAAEGSGNGNGHGNGQGNSLRHSSNRDADVAEADQDTHPARQAKRLERVAK